MYTKMRISIKIFSQGFITFEMSRINDAEHKKRKLKYHEVTTKQIYINRDVLGLPICKESIKLPETYAILESIYRDYRRFSADYME
jgi:hypothetical protein